MSPTAPRPSSTAAAASVRRSEPAGARKRRHVVWPASPAVSGHWRASPSPYAGAWVVHAGAINRHAEASVLHRVIREHLRTGTNGIPSGAQPHNARICVGRLARRLLRGEQRPAIWITDKVWLSA